LFLADFDGDGKIDISVSLYVLAGAGDGTFGPPFSFGQMNGLVLALDVNGDGKPLTLIK
jgi:hypothetical protein